MKTFSRKPSVKAVFDCRDWMSFNDDSAVLATAASIFGVASVATSNYFQGRKEYDQGTAFVEALDCREPRLGSVWIPKEPESESLLEGIATPSRGARPASR